jgi:cytochrome c oxidase cbb3-type subunit III
MKWLLSTGNRELFSRFLIWMVSGLTVFAGSGYAQLDRAAPPTNSNALAQDQARVAAGAQHFQQLCTGCHGRSGQGGQGEGQGPNLATSWEVRRAKDADLFGFIQNGVKGTAMPAFHLPDTQIWELAAFVRSLNAPAISVPAPGDAAAGETIFFGKGQCSSCHMIKGRGGYLGPDLSDIGASRRLAELRAAVLEPSARASASFEPLMVRDSEGHPLRAVAKHRSAWSAQILDERGGLHLIHGDAVQQLHFENHSWMTADFAKQLSPDEVTNLLTFLSRQSVRLPGPVAVQKGSVE